MTGGTLQQASEWPWDAGMVDMLTVFAGFNLFVGVLLLLLLRIVVVVVVVDCNVLLVGVIVDDVGMEARPGELEQEK